jgi:hypothetical protein
VAKTKYRLCEQDRAEYGGPEWVTFDMDVLAGARGRELERIEKELGHPIGMVVAALNGDGTAIGIRALVWLARRQAGLKTPFADFDIRTLRVDAEIVPDAPEVVDVAPLDDWQETSETAA